ncbi:MAG: response regulator transcription factor [Actinomycetota bacterium]
MALTTVLIIEDDPEMRDLITIVLRDGFKIIGHARDGEEGIRLAAKDPDVVVLDYVLPYMDGSEVGRRIRSVNPKIKILAFSAVDAARAAVDPQWADFFLPKSRVGDLPLVVEHLARAS